MKRAVLYIRVSTEDQVRHGLSVGEQLSSLRRWADDHGYTVVEIYQDLGISARKRYTRRPGLMRLLDDAAAGKFDLVLFIRLDRWVRSVRDYYAVQDVLDASGVTWQATQEDYETETAGGRFKVNIMLSVAQDEADKDSERIKFVKQGQKERGLSTNGRAPMGYKIVDHRPVVDEEKREAAADMFSELIRSRSVCQVCRHMESKWGIKRAYKNWGRALSNPIYKGDYFGFDCEALVSPDDWDLCQEIMAERSQRCASTMPDRTYLFSGLLFCSECGGRMTTSRTAPHGYEYIYYRCAKRMFGGQCSHVKRVREDALEEWLIDNLLRLARAHNIQIRKGRPKIDRQKRIDKIRARMTKLKDLYLDDLIERDEYAKDFAELQSQLAQEELEAAREEKPIDTKALRSALEVYQDLSKAGKKEFWSRTIRRIDTDDNGSFFVTLI